MKKDDEKSREVWNKNGKAEVGEVNVEARTNDRREGGWSRCWGKDNLQRRRLVKTHATLKKKKKKKKEYDDECNVLFWVHGISMISLECDVNEYNVV